MSQPYPTMGTVIASDQSALRVGSAKLIVDGTDTTLVRKAEIALRPSRVRARSLDHLLQLSHDIYNGALQHRRDAWHITRNSSRPTSISRFDQFNEVKELKGPHGSSHGDSRLRQVASAGSCQRATEKARMSGTSVANKNSSTLKRASSCAGVWSKTNTNSRIPAMMK
jgi:hypothetical protein